MATIAASVLMSEKLNKFAHTARLTYNFPNDLSKLPIFADFVSWPFINSNRSPKYLHDSNLNSIRRCIMGTGIFFFLSQGSFKSVFPSSLIALGAYSANARWNSIPTDIAATTAAQRLKIQSIGRRTGCHQCGSRLSFSQLGEWFVADHMPPTKFVERAKSRRWPFGRKVYLSFLWFLKDNFSHVLVPPED
jgi:hypothetical protein